MPVSVVATSGAVHPVLVVVVGSESDSIKVLDSTLGATAAVVNATGSSGASVSLTVVVPDSTTWWCGCTSVEVSVGPAMVASSILVTVRATICHLNF